MNVVFRQLSLLPFIIFFKVLRL